MHLIRLEENKSAAIPEYSDDVPNETEWHAPSFDSEFTACGLACTYGGTDREVFQKSGRLKDVTCAVCQRCVRWYKGLR